MAKVNQLGVRPFQVYKSFDSTNELFYLVDGARLINVPQFCRHLVLKVEVLIEGVDLTVND